MKEQINPFEGSALTTILVVSDMAKSKAFYTEILGASIYRAYGGTSIVLKFLNNWILLVTQGEPTKDKPETFFVSPSNSKKVDHSFTIRVNDCQESYEILKERGAKFITPPVSWGPETRCFFNDPDGHLFEISSYKE
jgi:catechol 2,3-dioxygenase-like lactoylglutathione lyase family enzyme